jgi:hypothetical protein
MTIYGLGRTEYHLIWRSDLAAFGSLAAASAVVDAQQRNNPGIMTEWRRMLGLPSISLYPDKEIVSEFARLLFDGTILTKGVTFDAVWRHPSACSRDRTLTLQFLAKFRGDPGTIARFRSLLVQQHQGASLYRLSDDEVFAGIATLLGSGELIVGFRSHQFGSFKNQDDGASPPSEGPAPPPPRSTSPPVEHEEPTFANHDAAAQAAALKAAAATGAPFCEQCAAG